MFGIWAYPSYWHYRIIGKVNSPDKTFFYYSACPNPGAGIGHQMANWIAGYWWASQFGLKFAHIPFSSKEWDLFLGFGNGEKTVIKLKKEGYRVRRLPRFSEVNDNDFRLQEDIMSSYSGGKMIFVAEQDQAYKDQFGVMENIQIKFYNAPSRKNDQLVYNKNHINIAVHIRRGDIMQDSKTPSLKFRYLSNDYYIKVLYQVIDNFTVDKEVNIYIFSQGSPEDFYEFDIFKNIHWCFDMNAQQSFLHMVYADILITSKSSFSYKPALLNKGIKVCPKDFWHGYPDSNDWYLCDNKGNLIWH